MHNVGKTDRIVRIILALIIVALDQFDVIKGDLASGLLFVAIVLAFTAINRCSPLYTLLGRGTCGLPDDENSEAVINAKKWKIK